MVSVACSKIKKHGKSMESMEYHHGHKEKTMMVINQKFSFHNNNIYSFSAISYLIKWFLITLLTLLNICKFLNKYIIVQVACPRGMKYCLAKDVTNIIYTIKIYRDQNSFPSSH